MVIPISIRFFKINFLQDPTSTYLSNIFHPKTELDLEFTKDRKGKEIRILQFAYFMLSHN